VDQKYVLFKSLIMPILNYGCEVWGFMEASSVEKVHLKFMKQVLRVKNSTPSAFVYGEMG